MGKKVETVKKPVGRPRLETDPVEKERLLAVIDEIASSPDSSEKIAQKHGLTLSVFWDKVKLDEFAELYARARSFKANMLVDRFYDMLFNPPQFAFGDTAAVQAWRTQMDNMKWIITKSLPKHFGDKQEVEVRADVKVEHTLNPSTADDLMNKLLETARKQKYVEQPITDAEVIEDDEE